MRVVRAVLGTLLVLIAVPMLLAGAGLWTTMQHRGPDGAFTAPVEHLRTDGYAIVVPELDGLLRRDAPFARGGQTSVRVTARGGGPLFVGLAPQAEVDRYLAGVRRLEVDRVRLTRGPLPLDARDVPGERRLEAAPGTQTFWLASGRSPQPLDWSPSGLRGQRVALVVLNNDAAAQVEVDLTAAVRPGWLDATSWGLLILGTVGLVLGAGVLAWPRSRRRVGYLVEPDRAPPAAGPGPAAGGRRLPPRWERPAHRSLPPSMVAQTLRQTPVERPAGRTIRRPGTPEGRRSRRVTVARGADATVAGERRGPWGPLPPTAPPTAPPAVPPAVPPTAPPAVPPAVPPTAPPAVPPALSWPLPEADRPTSPPVAVPGAAAAWSVVTPAGTRTPPPRGRAGQEPAPGRAGQEPAPGRAGQAPAEAPPVAAERAAVEVEPAADAGPEGAGAPAEPARGPAAAVPADLAATGERRRVLSGRLSGTGRAPRETALREAIERSAAEGGLCDPVSAAPTTPDR